MEQASLPLSYHCQNARLYLKKAAFCKKSCLFSDELSHLRKFETLVSSTIPSHPLFSISSNEKQVRELLDRLPDCHHRIGELEGTSGEDAQVSYTYKTLPKSPTFASSRKGIKINMPGSSRGQPLDSPAMSRRSSVGEVSPSKKQQSWGIWTANPQHDPSQLGSSPPLSFGGLSPPSSRKRAMLKGKKLVTAAKEPIIVPALPLRPRSPADQRLQAMIGGCALVANQLQPPGRKKVALEAETSAAAEVKLRSINPQLEGSPKRPLEWFLPPKGSQITETRKELFMTPARYTEGDQNSPDKSGQKFRFASEYYEKRLKDRIERIKRECPESDEDGSTSSPAKVRISLDRLTGGALLQEEEGSLVEETAERAASSSTLEMFAKHLDGMDPTVITGRLQRMAIVRDHEEISTERSQVLSSADDMWARKLVPVVEQKLCHDMLRPRMSSSSRGTPRSTRKRNRKRGVLGVMDDVIRRAVDSDSAVSNTTSPRLLVSGHDSSSEVKKRDDNVPDPTQSQALEAKISNLQNLVGELRNCIEGFTARVEEEGERWQSEMRGLEKDLSVWREETETELKGLNQGLKLDVQKIMDEVKVGLIKAERILEDIETSKQKPGYGQQAVEESSTNMEAIQRQMESLVANMKVDLLFELKERITSGMRRDLDMFELGVAKQFEGMKKDMESALAESEKIRRSERQQIDALLDDKMEKRFSQQRMEIVSGGREKVIADMKNELRLLWVEVDMLSKGREEMKETVRQLADIAEEAKQSFGEEQNALKLENGALKKQLQYFKKESVQARTDNDDFKKDIELEMEDIRLTVEKMKADGESLKSAMSKIMDSGDKADGNNSNNEGAQEQMLIMEKVEGISQLYLGGLEDVRSELLSFKLECHDRMDELEGHCAELNRHQQEQATDGAVVGPPLPLEQLVLDGLETRVSHLESRLEKNTNIEEQRLRTLDQMEKDRQQTSMALDHVASAAQKADEFVSEMVKSFSSELATVMRQSHDIDENLAAERDAAMSSAGGLKQMSEAMEKELQIAMVVISEAKAKGLKIQEGIEKEGSALKESLLLDKGVAAAAATNATEAASKAEAALLQIHKMQSESFSISEDIAEAAGQAYITYSKELEGHLNEWKKLMSIEVTRAKTTVEGLEEDRKRILGDEKPVPLAEFQQHIKRTEDFMVELERSIRETNASMEAQSTRMKDETEQKDAMMREEMKSLREKVAEACTTLDGRDVMQQDMKRIESKISEAMTAQLETAEKIAECFKKVRKLESVQLNTASSIEEVQANTGDLQKSASVWLQKYDAAARLLQDLEKRISALENGLARGSGSELPDEKLDNVDRIENMAPGQKERLLGMYRELSGLIQRMRAQEGGQDDVGKDKTSSTPIDKRLVSLENRVAQVEAETFSNLRVLDAKMEDFSVGVQTALEGASMAESKCTALGGELVKVFRMIATTRKDSPTKMTMMMEVTAGEESNSEPPQTLHTHHHHPQQQQQQPQCRGGGRSVAVKSKSQTACNHCKKVGNKGTICEASEGHLESYPSDVGGDNESRSPSAMERSLKIQGKQSPQPHPASRDGSPTFKIIRQLQKDKDEPTSLDSMWRKATSEGRIHEGKLPITVDESRVDPAKKLDAVQISVGKPDLQLNNIRLGDGKVHVNVSHRPPSSLTGARAIKRCDSMSAAQP